MFHGGNNLTIGSRLDAITSTYSLQHLPNSFPAQTMQDRSVFRSVDVSLFTKDNFHDCLIRKPDQIVRFESSIYIRIGIWMGFPAIQTIRMVFFQIDNVMGREAEKAVFSDDSFAFLGMTQV